MMGALKRCKLQQNWSDRGRSEAGAIAACLTCIPGRRHVPQCWRGRAGGHDAERQRKPYTFTDWKTSVRQLQSWANLKLTRVCRGGGGEVESTYSNA